MKRAADISNSQLHSETEATTNDLSILRKPIKTSVTGWNEARKAYDDGTDEVGFHNSSSRFSIFYGYHLFSFIKGTQTFVKRVRHHL